MYLVYFDESGQTGKNLNDKEQPIIVLGALIVDSSKWLGFEAELEGILDKYFPDRPVDFEVHAHELRRGDNHFQKFPIDHRIKFRDEWMNRARFAGCHFTYRSITKAKYAKWLDSEFAGTGIYLDPHVVAFCLLAQVINQFIVDQGEDRLGIFIADERKEIIADIERLHKILRTDKSELQLTRIIEKGFFVDSKKSLMLQLTDLFCYSARKLEESELRNTPLKPIDASGVNGLQSINHEGEEAFENTMKWLIGLQE